MHQSLFREKHKRYHRQIDRYIQQKKGKRKPAHARVCNA